MKKIALVGRNYVECVMVDDDDFYKLSAHAWRLHSGGYAYRGETIGGKYCVILMHRLIMNAGADEQVDHINHDRLDCRKQNLRICSHTQNNWNRSRNTRPKSGYIGVVIEGKQFVAQIRKDGKVVSLGRFYDPLDAAKAYDRAAIEIRGEFAVTNGVL
jgi:hypothetical protein